MYKNGLKTLGNSFVLFNATSHKCYIFSNFRVFEYEVNIFNTEGKKFNMKEVSHQTSFMHFSKKAQEIENGVKYTFRVETYNT